MEVRISLELHMCLVWFLCFLVIFPFAADAESGSGMPSLRMCSLPTNTSVISSSTATTSSFSPYIAVASSYIAVNSSYIAVTSSYIAATSSHTAMSSSFPPTSKSENILAIAIAVPLVFGALLFVCLVVTIVFIYVRLKHHKKQTIITILEEELRER